MRLFVVDELHLLDSDVGPTLEAVVSRMRYISVQVSHSRDLGRVGICLDTGPQGSVLMGSNRRALRVRKNRASRLRGLPKSSRPKDFWRAWLSVEMFCQ